VIEPAESEDAGNVLPVPHADAVQSFERAGFIRQLAEKDDLIQFLRGEVARLTGELAAKCEDNKDLQGRITALLKAQPVGIPS
jgi:hypothetical protein